MIKFNAKTKIDLIIKIIRSKGCSEDYTIKELIEDDF